ncbi:MAG: ribosome-associated GTPase EngA, partial [Chloroflexi bacterium]|nr:ribosome-associated GTPase EngA [Chloroflexota bacterium]
MSQPIVALVGRPNVGKSTLFNRLTGSQHAVVHDAPGTTRDRIYGSVEWRGRTFTIVDTGGIGLDESGGLQERIVAQAEAAIRQADVVIFVTSARDGPLGPEVSISDQLRRSEKPVLLTVNKADSPGDRLRATDFWELGLDEPHCISSTQGTGIGDLLDLVAER